MKDPFLNPVGTITRVRTSYVVGAVAGPLTVTGIKKQDRIVSVWNITTPADLTSQFSISAANTITNAGGTATTGGVVAVTWYDKDLGEKVDAGWVDDDIS